MQALAHATRVSGLILVLASIADAQNELWTRQFGTTDDDQSTTTAPDGAGGVYVGGFTSGALGGPYVGTSDAWFARYNSAGTQLWIRQLGTSGAESLYAIAPDDSGGAFVCGYSGGSLGAPTAGAFDAWLARYNSAGTQLWIRQWGTTADDFAVTLARDGSGGVFVSGGTRGALSGSSAGDFDVWLARYNGAWTQTWIRQFGSPGADYPNVCTPDGAGGVFVGGATNGSLGGSYNGGIYDAWLTRYDSAGTRIWIRQFGTNSDDRVWAATPDGAGGLFVGGNTGGSLGGPFLGGVYDGWLARYSSAGSRTWIRQFGTTADDRTWSATPDGAGGVFVCGDTGGSLGAPFAGGVFDAWLARYDGAGTRTTVRQFGTNADDLAWSATADGAGGLFLGGGTTGNIGGPNLGLSDAWLARYDGALVYTRYCSPGVPNSTTQSSRIHAVGSNGVAPNELMVIANQLPLNSFGYFLTSRNVGNTYPVNNSQGRLCLGGFIGRYFGPGQIKNSGGSGSFSLAINLSSMPQPLGNIAVQPGETWHFQAWHRDANPSATSNFTDALSVTLN